MYKKELRGLNFSKEPTVICVSGLTGYLSSWIIKWLIETLPNNYKVRVTVRNPKQTEKF
jgi:uncharacterized protein YbjT (DUF2867 family)